LFHVPAKVVPGLVPYSSDGLERLSVGSSWFRLVPLVLLVQQPGQNKKRRQVMPAPGWVGYCRSALCCCSVATLNDDFHFAALVVQPVTDALHALQVQGCLPGSLCRSEGLEGKPLFIQRFRPPVDFQPAPEQLPQPSLTSSQQLQRAIQGIE